MSENQEPCDLSSIANPLISIDRNSRSWAVFDGAFDLKKDFEPYESEEEALRLAHAWVAERTTVEARVVYPSVTRASYRR